MAVEPYLWKATGVVVGGKPRWLFIQRESCRVSFMLGLYEASISKQKAKTNTNIKKLEHANALCSFLAESGNEKLLLEGEPLLPEEIVAFKLWKLERSTGEYRGLTREEAATLNATLRGARQFERWVIRFLYRFRPKIKNMLGSLKDIDLNQRETWSELHETETKRSTVSSLSLDEAAKIERYLYKKAFSRKSRSSDFRNYLMWRLAYDYGIRIGEMLAIQMEDTPKLNDAALYITARSAFERAEDPRIFRRPQVKTLSRELDQYFSDNQCASVIAKYKAEFRYVESKYLGKTRRHQNFLHSYLLVTGKGAPLSMSAATDIARKISRETGVHFHWHRVRHTFFTAAYSAIAEMPTRERSKARSDLQVFGGWARSESLDVYIRKSVKGLVDRALLSMQEQSGNE